MNSTSWPASSASPVVLGERDREGPLLVLAHADEGVLEAGHHPLAADDQREPLRRGALDRLAVLAALEAR